MIEQKTLGTTNFLTIQALCIDAQQESQFIGVVGYPGAGKTISLTAYSKKNPHVYYVRVTTSMSAKQFFLTILQKLGLEGKSQGNTLHDLINSIAFKLNYSKYKKLLIIDEAGKFKPKFLEYLHELRDKTDHGTGIVMAGPEYFKDNILNWSRKGVVGIPELLRRVNHWEQLDPPTKEEIHALCETYNVNSLSFRNQLWTTVTNFAEAFSKIKNYLKLKEKNKNNKSVQKN